MNSGTKEAIYALAEAHYNPNLVAINHEAIERLALPTSQMALLPSNLPSAFHGSPRHGIAFMIALNSINYMFWSLGLVNGKKALTRYSFDGVEGAAGMRIAFDRFWGIDPAPDRRLSQVFTAESIAYHFGAIPDPHGRGEILTEIFSDGKIESFARRLHEKLLATGRIGADDAADLSDLFPRAYNDPYHKRSQLAMAMIAGFMGECGLMLDTSDLTLFADYQVPRSLRAMEVLVLSPEVQALVDSLALIDEDSAIDRAIRSATVLAGRAMARRLGVTEAALDNFLWQFRKLAGALKFHLTLGERH